jgi:hypothetical protein
VFQGLKIMVVIIILLLVVYVLVCVCIFNIYTISGIGVPRRGVVVAYALLGSYGA